MTANALPQISSRPVPASFCIFILYSSVDEEQSGIPMDHAALVGANFFARSPSYVGKKLPPPNHQIKIFLIPPPKKPVQAGRKVSPIRHRAARRATCARPAEQSAGQAAAARRFCA